MTDVLAAEWTKLRTVRSTTWVLTVCVATVLLGALFVWYAGNLWESTTPERRAQFRAAAPEQGFLPVVQICLAVLGVLAVSSEYATGMIRTSLAAVPRRGTLLAAKAATVGLFALLVGQGTTLATFTVGRLVAGDRELGFNTEPVADAGPMLVASGLSVLVVALLGLGLGTVLRSTAGAIVTVVVLLFVLPTAVNLLPDPWNIRLASVALPNLADQLAGDRRISSQLADGLLSPPWAAVVLAAYAIAPLAAAAVAIKRRDA